MDNPKISERELTPLDHDLILAGLLRLKATRPNFETEDLTEMAQAITDYRVKALTEQTKWRPIDAEVKTLLVHASDLLEEEANCIFDSHASPVDGSWGNETTAQASYDDMMATASRLNRIADALPDATLTPPPAAIKEGT